MKVKLFLLKILFLFLSVTFFISCESIDIKEELINGEDNKSKFQAIGHDEVEDPGDRGDKD